MRRGRLSGEGDEKDGGHPFQVDKMIITDFLAPKRRSNLLRMGILIIPDGLHTESVVECIFG